MANELRDDKAGYKAKALQNPDRGHGRRGLGRQKLTHSRYLSAEPDVRATISHDFYDLRLGAVCQPFFRRTCTRVVIVDNLLHPQHRIDSKQTQM